MRQPADFWRIFSADLILRSAYQMGKTPLLPLYAAALGGGELLIGTIVSVSVVTGLVLKPLFGALSDRWGRRIWFFAALAIFTGAPFLYGFVTTSEQLLALRAVHGLATAIFGPVTLAFVAEMAASDRGARLGLFGFARGAGYLIAPALAGWLLTIMVPERVFTLIGFASLLAALPILLLQGGRKRQRQSRRGLVGQIADGIAQAGRRIEVWLAGGLELAVYIVTYAVKAFLPVYAVTELGVSIFAAGVFFTVQEAAHLITRPLGGRLGDRFGYLNSIGLGMICLAGTLFALLAVNTTIPLLAVALLAGVAQGLILPCTVALIGSAVDDEHQGAAMGLFGSLRNIGKVAGPIAVGALLQVYSFPAVFQGLGLSLLIVLTIAISLRQRRLRDERA